MKRIILSILLATACISASATEQINDKIIINGETWEVLSSPIESLDGQTIKPSKHYGVKSASQALQTTVAI